MAQQPGNSAAHPRRQDANTESSRVRGRDARTNNRSQSLALAAETNAEGTGGSDAQAAAAENPTGATTVAGSNGAARGRYTRDDEGFLTRIPRRRASPTRGSRQGSTLRVAPFASRCFVWVYNLHIETTAEEVKTYVGELLEDQDVKVEQPTLKRTDSAAFMVSCQKKHFNTLLAAESWEEHVRVRPYRHPNRAPAAVVPQRESH